jgi:SAM-dependent methyltransferase
MGRALAFGFPGLRELAAGEIAGLPAQDRGRLLDIGCGNGGFLKTMRALGWDVHGIEPDPAAARVASRTLGNVIYQGSIADAPFGAGSFDVVVMKHVIEHLHDPIASLVHCHRFLRPGGKVVLLTPNARSLGGTVFGRDWLGWDVPRHLFIFSPEAIRTVLERAGFRRVRVETPGRKAARMWQMSKALRRGRTLGTVVGLNAGRTTMAAVMFWLFESGLVRISPRGEELWAMAEKS